MRAVYKVIGIISIWMAGVLSQLGAQPVELTIRYYDKRVYFAGQKPVFIQVTLTNRGASTYRFKLADDRAFSIDFDVRTLNNRPVEATEVLIRKRSTSQRIYFRELSLEPGESFSFTEDLTDYSAITSAGSYVVQAIFYPELLQRETPTQSPSLGGTAPNAGTMTGAPTTTASAPGTGLRSNTLALSIRPAPLPEQGKVAARIDVETNEILQREPLSPDKVIEYLLTARQKGQWEKFFLYLDLEALLLRDPVKKRMWLAESEEGRLRMLDKFRSDLKSAVVDGDIVTIPMEFQVEKTTYGPEQGTVTVLEKFRVGRYIERKRYIYSVEKKDNIWMVVDYAVINLGTE